MNPSYSAFPPHFYTPDLTTTADQEQSGNNDCAQITEYTSDLRFHRQIYVSDNDEFEYSAEQAASIPNYLRDNPATRHHDARPIHPLARQLDYQRESLSVHEATPQDDLRRWDTGPAITPSALFTGYFGERLSSTGYHVSVAHSLTDQLDRREEIFPMQKTTTQPDGSHGQLQHKIDFELGLLGIHQMSRMDWGLNLPPVHKTHHPNQIWRITVAIRSGIALRYHRRFRHNDEPRKPCRLSLRVRAHAEGGNIISVQAIIFKAVTFQQMELRYARTLDSGEKKG
ncbi:hypothetical protein BU17DRAFT_64249 [Hysterangium stoloniferum]|nr:hypothetical protein BU17DRAFT_64249 [Hysterangium stoloniferum]